MSREWILRLPNLGFPLNYTGNEAEWDMNIWWHLKFYIFKVRLANVFKEHWAQQGYVWEKYSGVDEEWEEMKKKKKEKKKDWDWKWDWRNDRCIIHGYYQLKEGSNGEWEWIEGDWREDARGWSREEKMEEWWKEDKKEFEKYWKEVQEKEKEEYGFRVWKKWTKGGENDRKESLGVFNMLYHNLRVG